MDLKTTSIFFYFYALYRNKFLIYTFTILFYILYNDNRLTLIKLHKNCQTIKFSQNRFSFVNISIIIMRKNL